ncbi:hypothetical protein Micbo1qcDRAFT_172474 [Microdochium bolleyi]|uniref:Uncharacterized protein n=1 Tax=Microdochium bolleyi TaxID=196109 RepID=A0A136JGE3_9PEZI|nr:hypothetical protein Micbo1qcDRAFT_172474 [Microdochium bolleyi]
MATWGYRYFALQVCSRTLARSSAVFDVMRDVHAVHRIQTRTSRGRILFYLIHCNYTLFRLGPDFGSPKDVNIVYTFFVAVHKYDCAMILQPWASSWRRHGYYSQTGPANEITRKNCTDRILGALLRELIRAKLWPMPKLRRTRHSSSSFKEIVNSASTGNTDDYSHRDCRPFDTDFDESTVIALTYTASSAETEYMATQAKKTGVDTF